MLSKLILRTFILFAVFSQSVLAVFADAFEPFYIANVKAEGHSQFMTGIRGSCAANSHIAKGAIGSDLTSHQTPFPCDAAILTYFDSQNKHAMVTFAKRATTKGVISFAGQMDEKANMLNVQKVYLEAGKPVYFDDAACKFFFSGRHMTGIACIGKYDADGQRTVVGISYGAEPGQ